MVKSILKLINFVEEQADESLNELTELKYHKREYLETNIMLPLFFVLGFLDENNGRRIWDNDDLVERFYKTEKSEAEIFRHYLMKLCDEEDIEAFVRTEINEAKHIIFRSPVLCTLLNAQYKWEASGYTYDSLTSAVKGRYKVAYISKEIFKSDNRNEKLSFLAGSYIRFRGEGFKIFRFVNAKHKAKLVAELLKEFGSTHIKVLRDNPGWVPAVFIVSFNPSAEIKQWLSSVKKVTDPFYGKAGV